MKNTFTLCRNLNRARSTMIPLLISTLVALIVFSLAACDDGNDYDAQGLYFTLISYNNESAKSYSVSKGTVTGGAVVIPATYKGLPVSTIDEAGFRKGWNGDTDITSVSIPASVWNIRRWAFYGCSSLTNVTIPASVTTIGPNAFADCSSLTSVTFAVGGASIRIGSDAFPEGAKGWNGDNLKTAYFAGGTGTYTRSGSTWTKQ